MSEAGFNPANELESVLVDAKEGRVAFEDFLKLLLESDVHVSSGAEVQVDGTGFQPLLFDKDNETLMAVFTSRERATKFGKRAPFCLTIKGRQLIERVPSDFGLVFNPGYTFGFEVPAQGVQEIRRAFTTAH